MSEPKKRDCLKNCKIGDIIVWSNGQQFRVDSIYNGQSITAVETKLYYIGTFYDRYIKAKGGGIDRIIKCSLVSKISK
jgi:hypothetical protein